MFSHNGRGVIQWEVPLMLAEHMVFFFIYFSALLCITRCLVQSVGFAVLLDTQYTKQQLHDFASSAIISLKPVICECHFVCFACSSLHSCQDLSVSLIDC